MPNVSSSRLSRVVGRLALVAGVAVAAPVAVHAQALGPQRQFLAIEPYYARIQFDAAEGASRVGLNGYGGRLWINFAPFSGPSPNLVGNGAIALFATYTPTGFGNDQNLSILHYGAQHDIFFVRRPLGGVIDPFLSIGGGVYRVNVFNGAAGQRQGVLTKGSLLPGAGIRIPMPNRFQLRFDAHDAILFGSPTGRGGESWTSHNLEFTGALGITF